MRRHVRLVSNPAQNYPAVKSDLASAQGGELAIASSITEFKNKRHHEAERITRLKNLCYGSHAMRQRSLELTVKLKTYVEA